MLEKMPIEELRKKEPRDPKLPTISLEELALHDGTHKERNNKMYICVKDLIFDVSESDHYKEAGGYKAFKGKDVSVGIAKMDFAD